MKIIILAGGDGTRLWPYSTKEYPKQFLKINDDLSLLQRTIERIYNISFVNEIVIVTNVKYIKIVESQIKELDCFNKIHIVVEPHRKNTFPAVLLSLKYIEEKLKAKENEKILIIPSDHFISDKNEFFKIIEKLYSNFEENKIYALGKTPKHFSCHYGYIEKGVEHKRDIFKVEKFIEKPKTENELIKDKEYYWNLGIYFFSIKTFLNEVRKYSFNDFRIYNNSYKKVFNSFFYFTEKSIDFSIMEKSKNLLFSNILFDWKDVGTIESISEALLNNKEDKILDIIHR